MSLIAVSVRAAKAIAMHRAWCSVFNPRLNARRALAPPATVAAQFDVPALRRYWCVGLVVLAALCASGVTQAQERNDNLCTVGAGVATPDFDAGWFHNAPGLTRTQDGVWRNPPGGPINYWNTNPPGADTTIVASAADEVIGAGLVSSPLGLSVYTYAGVNAGGTLANAVAQNDYLQYQFTTPATLAGRPFFKRTGFGSWGTEQWQYAVRVSTDPNFATYYTIAQDFTVAGSGGNAYAYVPANTSKFPLLNPGTTYFVRVYLYNLTSGVGPGMSATLANQPAADDFQFGTGICPQPTLQVSKVSTGGVGSFGFSGNNGIANHTITTVTAGTGVQGALQTLTAANTITTVTEAAPPAGFSLIGASCTGLPAGQVSSFDAATRTVTVPAAAVVDGGAIACTFTNRRSANLRLAKAWGANSIAGDVASLGATTGLTNNTALFTSTAPNNAAGTPVTVFTGEVATLPAETMPTGTLGRYTTAIACSGGSLSGSNGQANGNTLTINSADAGTTITCTYTNTRISQPLNLAKSWINGGAGHTASATTTGATNNASFASTVPGPTNGAAVTAFAGETITLPAEAFGGGATAAQYTTTVACTGGTTLAASAPPQTITIANAATATVCTYTNTRIAKTLTLQKQWSGATVGDDATLTVSRGAGVIDTLASDAGSAGELDVDPTPTAVFAGESLTLAETLAAANIGLYNTTLACTGGGSLSGSTLSVDTTAANVICTYTNTARRADLSVTKTNTPLAGANDQTNDTVVRGAASNYSLVVRNNGPDAADGAVLRDPAPVGLTCTTAVCGSATGGAVCPAPGALTVAALQSVAGVSIPALPANAQLTVTLACTVQ